LYAFDWSYGRIFAVHLKPQGATYAAEREVFLKGKPLNLTDLEFGKDGAMYSSPADVERNRGYTA